MGFNEFIGNRVTIGRLRTKLREGRFPHALIFGGPDGVGKRTCAIMIAKTLNCIQELPDDFCGTCSACRKIDSGVHPDVMTVGVEEEASEIKIAQIRQVLEKLELHPLEGRAKVFIIDPAGSMNTAAENALLKGLEEPPENSYFILVTNNPQELLPTSRSRSQSYYFTPVALEELRRMAEPGAREELLLRWSRGSVGAVRTLQLSTLKPRRDDILDFLESAVRATEETFRDLVAASADLARSKSDFEGHIEILAVLLGDLLYLRENLPERIVNVDVRDRLARLASEIDADRFMKVIEFLRVMESGIKSYLNRQIMTDVLALTANGTVSKIAHDNPAKSR